MLTATRRSQRAPGIDDGPERLADDVLAATHRLVEPELAAALAAQGPPLVAWLADRCGAQVELFHEHVAAGHSVARLHGPGERGGASLSADLARAASRHSHVSVRPATLAERLVRDDSGAVRGVSVRGERRGAGQALGGRVLLACGGFAGDDALVAEHCPAVAPLPFQGGARATGDGLRLGREAGAATRRLASFLVTPFLATPGHLVPSAPLVDLGAVLVNQAGRRFADETAESLPLATIVRAQPGGVAYLLFGERTAAAARAADPFFARVVLPRAGRRGATLEDLAKQFELDAEGLRLTVETFNPRLAPASEPLDRNRLRRPLDAPAQAAPHSVCPPHAGVDLLRPHHPDRHDRHVERERESRETRAEGPQAVAIAERLRYPGNALRKHEQQFAGLQERDGVLARRDRPAHLVVEACDRGEVLDEAIVEEAEHALAAQLDRGDDHRPVERDRPRVIRDQERRPARRHVADAGRLDPPVAIVQEASGGQHAPAEPRVEPEGILARGVVGLRLDLEFDGWSRHTNAPSSAHASPLPAALYSPARRRTSSRRGFRSSQGDGGRADDQPLPLVALEPDVQLDGARPPVLLRHGPAQTDGAPR